MARLVRRTGRSTKEAHGKSAKSADQEPEHTILNFSYLAIVAID